MVEVDTFLTALYVTVEDFYKSRPRERRRPGPDASLSPSEVVTLAVFARFSRFTGERDFHLSGPLLPPTSLWSRPSSPPDASRARS